MLEFLPRGIGRRVTEWREQVRQPHIGLDGSAAYGNGHAEPVRRIEVARDLGASDRSRQADGGRGGVGEFERDVRAEGEFRADVQRADGIERAADRAVRAPVLIAGHEPDVLQRQHLATQRRAAVKLPVVEPVGAQPHAPHGGCAPAGLHAVDALRYLRARLLHDLPVVQVAVPGAEIRVEGEIALDVAVRVAGAVDAAGGERGAVQPILEVGERADHGVRLNALDVPAERVACRFGGGQVEPAAKRRRSVEGTRPAVNRCAIVAHAHVHAQVGELSFQHHDPVDAHRSLDHHRGEFHRRDHYGGIRERRRLLDLLCRRHELVEIEQWPAHGERHAWCSAGVFVGHGEREVIADGYLREMDLAAAQPDPDIRDRDTRLRNVDRARQTAHGYRQIRRRRADVGEGDPAADVHVEWIVDGSRRVEAERRGTAD